MSKKDRCEVEEVGNSSVKVLVDVTKIVKYVCIAGVVIVAIIFGTKCSQNILKEDLM